MKKLITLLTQATLLVISAVSYGQQGPAANVNVAIASDKLLSPVAWVSGSVVSRNNSELAAEVSGRLINIAELGTKVKQGETIAKIDDTTLTLQFEEEKAKLANANAKLAYEKTEIQRKKALVKQKLISQTELDQSVANYDIAQANHAAATARLAQAKQNLTFTELKAPFDGLIVEKLSHKGEYVNSGTNIIRLVETNNIEATISAPLVAYRFVKVNNKMAIRSPLGSANVPIKAIIPVADNRSHLMEIRLDMTSVDWPIGLNIQAAVPNGETKNVLAVPRDAIVLRRNSTSVFRINNDNKAEQIQVSLGLSEGELIEVIGDISAGDKVVIRGAERLQPGQSVNIKNNNQALISGNS